MTKLTNKRGRPRSEQAKAAIQDAFIEVLNQVGYADLSIDAVAKTAGVSRTTIYRWYKSKEFIGLEVVANMLANEEFVVKTGDYKADIRLFLQKTFLAAKQRSLLFTALLAKSQIDKEFAEQVWERFSIIRRAQLSEILLQNPQFEQNSEHSIRLETIMDLFFGSIWYRLMSQHAALDQSFEDQLVLMLEKVLD